jgi:hypothetical protein
MKGQVGELFAPYGRARGIQWVEPGTDIDELVKIKIHSLNSESHDLNVNMIIPVRCIIYLNIGG